MDSGIVASEHRHLTGRAAAFFSRIGASVDLTDEENALLALLLAGPSIKVRRGEDLIRSDEPVRSAYVLRDGWAIWQDIRADGSRQVLDFFLPGDAVGLGMLLLHDRLLRGRAWSPLHITALTPIVAIPIERQTFNSLNRFRSELSTKLLALAFVDRSVRFHRRMANFGRASARERTADLLLELWERQQVVGRVDGNSYSLPASQGVLADFLRLAPAYLSRILTALENDRIVSVQSSGERRVIIHDVERLRDAAMEEHEAGDPLDKKW